MELSILLTKKEILKKVQQFIRNKIEKMEPENLKLDNLKGMSLEVVDLSLRKFNKEDSIVLKYKAKNNNKNYDLLKDNFYYLHSILKENQKKETTKISDIIQNILNENQEIEVVEIGDVEYYELYTTEYFYFEIENLSKLLNKKVYIMFIH